jgi:hypothetical protein
MTIEIPKLPEIVTPDTPQMHYCFSFPSPTDPEARHQTHNLQIADIPILSDANVLIEAHTIINSYHVHYFNHTHSLVVQVSSYELAKLYYSHLKEGKELLIDEIQQQHPELFI